MADQLGQVAPRRGLAAGEMDLQYAHLCGLRHEAAPFLRRELVAGSVQRQRIRAVRALQRAAVRQLREQGQGRGLSAHADITPLSERSCSKALTSRRITSRG